MDKIFVATDFTESATNATNYAVGLAKKAYASIVIANVVTLQVIDPVAPAFYVEPMFKEKEEGSKKILEKLKGDLSKEQYPDGSANLQVETMTSIGVPAEEINKLSENVNTDIVVAGSKGGDLLTRLLGSTVVDLSDVTHKPLLVVPKSAKFNGIKSIVCATDLKKGDSGAIRHMINFAKTFNAHILIVHINDKNSDIEDKEFEKLKKDILFDLEYGQVDFESVRLKNPSAVLDLITSMENADLLVLRKYERSFLSDVFHDSMTTDKIYNSEIPVLIYH